MAEVREGKRVFAVLADEMQGDVALVVELWGPDGGERDPMVMVQQGEGMVCFPGNLWRRFVAEVDAELAPEWRSQP